MTSEPPLCLSYTVLGALRQAVTSARQDAGTTGWFQMGECLSVSVVCLIMLVHESVISEHRLTIPLLTQDNKKYTVASS